MYIVHSLQLATTKNLWRRYTSKTTLASLTGTHVRIRVRDDQEAIFLAGNTSIEA